MKGKIERDVIYEHVLIRTNPRPAPVIDFALKRSLQRSSTIPVRRRRNGRRRVLELRADGGGRHGVGGVRAPVHANVKQALQIKR